MNVRSVMVQERSQDISRRLVANVPEKVRLSIPSSHCSVWQEPYPYVRIVAVPERLSSISHDNCAGSGYVKSKKKIQVAIPAGIDNGQSIRIRAKGEPGINGGERGDLLVTVLVDRDPRFQRQEYDLYSSEPITFTQAALGGKITVTTIDGPYELEIKPGTQTDTKVKLKGKGVPTLRNKTVRGDHYITLVVQVPDKLTEEQKSILNQYANTTVNARSSTDAASSGSSIFGEHKRKKGFKKDYR